MMKTYFLKKDGKTVEINSLERIEHLKSLSKKIREKILEESEDLFPDEIKPLTELIKIELEFIVN